MWTAGCDWVKVLGLGPGYHRWINEWVSATSKPWLSTSTLTRLLLWRQKNNANHDETVEQGMCSTVRTVIDIKSKHKQILQSTTYDSPLKPLLPNVTVFQNNSSAKRAVATLITFLLRQSSKVKSLFFPKISSQSLFNIYLTACMNERASCVENLVINFAPSIITVLIVFARQGHIYPSWPGLNEWFDIPTAKRAFWKLTSAPQQNAKTILKAFLQLNGFWHGRGRVLS